MSQPAPAYHQEPVTRRRLAVTVFFLAFLIFQVAVPTFQLRAIRPARWGWQMYAGIPATPTFMVELHDGTTQPVDVVAQLGYNRMELNLEAMLPPYLCRITPEAHSVHIELPGEQLQKYRCRS
jgi:hypothetical protein